MVCEEHSQWLTFDYCVFCALEDKYRKRGALYKRDFDRLDQLETAWEQAVNLYPDLENICPVASQNNKQRNQENEKENKRTERGGSMIKIEITEELIDWLEEHADGLSREDCVEFAQEFVSFIMMTGALTIERDTKKLNLVFHDWIKEESGKSVYYTEEGIELSLGDFHSGTTFAAEIQLEDYQGEFEAAAKSGIVPVFYAISKESS